MCKNLKNKFINIKIGKIKLFRVHAPMYEWGGEALANNDKNIKLTKTKH